MSDLTAQHMRKEPELNTQVEKCTKCFSAAADTISHSALASEMAAKLYDNIHESGNLPAMCRQDNGRYFVCYEPNDPSQRGAVKSWP